MKSRAAGKNVLRFLVGAVGVGLVAYLVARLGPAAIGAHLASAGWGFAWLVLAYAAGTAVTALPWHWLLPAPARPRLRDTVASRFAASGANAVLPLFAVGGEPSRLLWLPAERRGVGLAGIVVDRLLFAVASVLFLLAGTITVVQIAVLPRSYLVATAALALGALAIAAGAAWLAANRSLAARIHRLVQRFRDAPVAELTESALGSEVDARLEDLLKRRRPRLGASVFVHLVGRALLGVEVYAGFVVIGAGVTPAEGLVLASVPVALAIAGSWIPSQIGVQEGGLAVVSALLGIDPAAGIAVVVLQRIRQAGTVAIGWGLIYRRAGRRDGALASGSAAPGSAAPDESGDGARMDDQSGCSSERNSA